MLVVSNTIEPPWIVTIPATSERRVSGSSTSRETDSISPQLTSIRSGPSSLNSPESSMLPARIEFPSLMSPRLDTSRFLERVSCPPSQLSSRLSFSVKSPRRRLELLEEHVS